MTVFTWSETVLAFTTGCWSVPTLSTLNTWPGEPIRDQLRFNQSEASIYLSNHQEHCSVDRWECCLAHQHTPDQTLLSEILQMRPVKERWREDRMSSSHEPRLTNIRSWRLSCGQWSLSWDLARGWNNLSHQYHCCSLRCHHTPCQPIITQH